MTTTAVDMEFDEGIVFEGDDDDKAEQERSMALDKSIQDKKASFLTGQKTLQYLEECQKMYNFQKRLQKHKSKRPTLTVKSITQNQLLEHLREIVTSHYDDLDYKLWITLSTKLHVAFYIQSDVAAAAAAVVKVLYAFTCYLRF